MKTAPHTKVAIIGTVGLPAQYGGFETLAEHLVRNLGEMYDFTVYCTTKKYPKHQRQTKYLNAKLKYLPLDANGLQSIFYDTLSIIHALFYADVLLILGVSGAWILPFVYYLTNKKIVISIDGIEWKRNKWSKPAKWYLWWAEKIAVKYSHIDISDNESIQDYTAVRYGKLSKIVEYGADHVLNVKPTKEDKEKYPFLNNAYAIKVCRIEPENNVHVVLSAFSKLHYRLVMIGNWNASEYGRNMKNEYSIYKNITLLDPIYEQKTLDMIRGNAILYIHGHSAGGTNPSLVEAMYLNLPVIAFNVSYNRTTTENKAFYFNNTNELETIVNGLSFETLKENQITMKSIANRRYTWRVIANKYHYLIQNALVAKRKKSIQPQTAELPTSLLVNNELGHLKHQHLFYEK